MPVPTCYIFAAGDPDRSARPAPGDFLIAADAGYLTMERQGLTPDLVVGDFDSMPPPDHPHLVRHPVEKDDTDAALAVEEGLKRGFRRFVLCGALGGPRLDHTLANLQLLARLSRGGCEAFLTGGGTVVFALTDGRVCFPPPARAFSRCSATANGPRGSRSATSFTPWKTAPSPGTWRWG